MSRRVQHGNAHHGPCTLTEGVAITDAAHAQARSRFGVLAARIRLPLLYLAVAIVLADGLVPAIEVPPWLTLPLFVAGLALAYRIGSVGGAPITVAPPVSGRWQAVNTPASKVPSHGLHAYAQTYALDLIVPHDDRASRWWPITRAADAFPAFGRPVHAAADGTVARTSDWQRDHRSRDSLPGLAFVLVEGLLREVAGPAGLLGNHVIVAHEDGTYTTYAHLQNDSLAVVPGEQVRAGQVIAACGNSGNSTEPHLHFQVQDRADTLIAAGLPVAFDNVRHDGYPVDVPPATHPVTFAAASAGRASPSGSG